MPETEKLLISARDAAAMLGISRAFFYGMIATGRLGPAPVKLGRRRLYKIDELRDWCRAGCPARDKWLLVGHDMSGK